MIYFYYMRMRTIAFVFWPLVLPGIWHDAEQENGTMLFKRITAKRGERR